MRKNTYTITIIKIIIFIIFIVVCLLPLYWLIKSSFTTEINMYRSPPELFPLFPVFRNYIKLFERIPFFRYLVNSLIISIGSGVVSVFFGFLAAYALTRIKFRGSNIILIVLLLSTALPQILTLFPLFELFNRLKLVNTYHGVIILITSLLLPFTIWIMISFIRQVPYEIEEAAIVDGASQFTIIMRIVFPLVLPGIASMMILNFISSWNELLYPLIFTTTFVAKPFSVALGEIIFASSSFGRPWDLITALTTIMIIPPILLIIFFQRYIISGLTRGSIK
ncbi:MAG: carbohydrate ABC transporter permease [Actinobacteria bacterium]|nr:carbohydrate ABC transporter permease [Actinomycetota bacterium]